MDKYYVEFTFTVTTKMKIEAESREALKAAVLETVREFNITQEDGETKAELIEYMIEESL